MTNPVAAVPSCAVPTCAAPSTCDAERDPGVPYQCAQTLSRPAATVRSRCLKTYAIRAATHAMRWVYAAATGASNADVTTAVDATVKAATWRPTVTRYSRRDMAPECQAAATAAIVDDTVVETVTVPADAIVGTGTATAQHYLLTPSIPERAAPAATSTMDRR